MGELVLLIILKLWCCSGCYRLKVVFDGLIVRFMKFLLGIFIGFRYDELFVVVNLVMVVLMLMV